MVQVHPIKRAPRGVGMIEILVTLFILSIGLLGVASMQFVGSFANADAISRTQSDLVAQQFTERLRAAARTSATRDGVVVTDEYFDADTYNFAGLNCASNDPYTCHCLAVPASIANCRTGTCTEEEMAEFDGWSLSCAAVQTNPKTQVAVTCNDIDLADADACSAGSRIEIMVRWPVATSASRDYTLNARCNPNSGDSFACIIKDITL